jgi:hypothetical protein
MDGCVDVLFFLLMKILYDAAGLNTIWRQPSTKSPGETDATAAALVVSSPAPCQPATFPPIH